MAVLPGVRFPVALQITPKINAILLVKGTLKDTDYSEMQKKNEENKKKKMKQLKAEEQY